MRNITAILVALLLAASCSSAPSAGSAISGQIHNRPNEPKPKCAEAIDAAQLRNPVPAILGEGANPVYGPGSADYMTDTDGDGLTKWVERMLGTNPQDPDTDGDGISDGAECTELDTDPLDTYDPSRPTFTTVPHDPDNPPQYRMGLIEPDPDTDPLHPAPPPTTTRPLWPGSLSLTATATSCPASVAVKWGPRAYLDVTSFTLAAKGPSGGWTTHSAHPQAARSFTVVGLSSGLHSFKVLTHYTDGHATISNTVEVAVSDCPTSTTTTRPLGPGVFLSTTSPSCTSVTIKWNPSTYLEVASFTLASKAPGGGWITHSTHLPGARSFTIGGLVSGLHSFQVMAAHTDGNGTISNIVEVAVSDCPPPGSEDD